MHGREHGGAVRQDRRLRVVRLGELVFRACEHEVAEREREGFVDRPERVARRRKPLCQILAHPDSLRALPRAEPHGRYHCTTMLAHVKPAPNATNITFIPGCSRPVRTASSRAMATEAADVLPSRPTLTYPLSMGTTACLAA